MLRISGGEQSRHAHSIVPLGQKREITGQGMPAILQGTHPEVEQLLL
jgi:hypothetical protein